MAKNRNRGYDIFVNYRRDDGRQYARLVEKELKNRGFSVFIDYDELTDGIFENIIIDAIRSAKVFIIVLTPKYLDRVKEQDDWCKREIELAAKQKKQIVPIVPDGCIHGFSKEQTEGLPELIKTAVSKIQWSEVSFGQTMDATFSMMIENRILKYAKPWKEKRRRLFSIIGILMLVLLTFISVSFGLDARRHALMMEEFSGKALNWNPKSSLVQIKTILDIMDKMVPVEGGTFMMGTPDDSLGEPGLETPPVQMTVSSFHIGKYEMTRRQWMGIMGKIYFKTDSLMPVVSISYDDVERMLSILHDLTGLDFDMPTESEWEYAARGGRNNDGYIFSGSDDIREVAWYRENSGGVPHVCDAYNSPMTCNSLNIYDMSGNVCEWCKWDNDKYRLNTDILNHTVSNDIIYNEGLFPIRGGGYDSYPKMLTVFHRETGHRSFGYDNIGVRLVLR